MALTFFWRCENAALDGTDDFSAGDTSGTATGTAAINTTAVKVGTNGVQISASADRYNFDSASIINPTTGSVGFWINWQTFSTAGATWFYVRGSNANDHLLLSGTNTNELRFTARHNTTGAVNLDTTAANVATGNWYFVTASWDDNIDTRRLRVYNDAGTIIEEVTGTYTPPADFTNTANLRFGEAQGFAAAFYLDNIFVGSAYADADTFLTNRNITSYTQYSVGGSTAVPVFVHHLRQQGIA